MHLQHAECRRFLEHAPPRGGVEFVGAVFERERIGAIGAAERAAVRQLGKQAKRARRALRSCVHQTSISLFSTNPFNIAETSVMMRSRGALNVFARSSTISFTVASPLQRFTISAAIASALNTRSGASSTQPPCASLCVRRTPRGSFGFASAEMVMLTPAAQKHPAEYVSARHRRDAARRASTTTRRT